MKIFRYKFTRVIYILIAAVMAIAIAGLGVTLWQVIAFGLRHSAVEAFTILRYVLQFIVTTALFTISLLFLTASYYGVDEKHFKTSFGFLKTKYDIADIDEITLDRATEKLSVILKNDTCVNVVIKRSEYENFVQAVLDVNPKIEYSIKSKTSTGGDDEKKS